MQGLIFFHKLFKLNLRSVILNFRLFPIRQAIKLPLLVSCKTKLTVDRGGVVLEGDITPGMIQYGFSYVGTIDAGNVPSSLMIAQGGKLVVRGRVYFGAGCKISIGKDACIDFAGKASFSGKTELLCHKGLFFGDDVLVSWDCLFMDTDFHKIIQDGKILNNAKDIHIGKHVWIGCRTTVLKGSDVAAGCVVGAGSVVSGKLQHENSIYAGVPACCVKENVAWED